MEEYRKESDKYVEEVISGKKKIDPERAKKTLIMTPHIFAKVFSPERIRLILYVKKNKENNIYKLAKELGRPYEGVHRDIKYLEGIGIIKIKTKDKKKIPTFSGPIEFPDFAVA